MTLRLAVKLHMYTSDAPLPDRLARLRELGLDGVEVATPSPDDTVRLARAALGSGIAVPTVSADGTFAHSATDADPAERAAARAALERGIHAAGLLGSEVVMVSPGWDRPDLPFDGTQALCVETFGETIAAAADQGIVVAVENLWNGWVVSSADLVQLADALGARVLFDTGNSARYTAPQHDIHRLAERIVRIDLKDYRREWFSRPARVYADDAELRAGWGPDGPWGALDALPFDGDIDWTLVAAALGDIGYDGWICAENGGGGDDWIGDIAGRLHRFRRLMNEVPGAMIEGLAS